MSGGGTEPLDRAAIDALDFEAAFARLEAAVRRLEDSGLPLDDALGVYEEGAALAARCSLLLESARLRLSRVTPAGTQLPADSES
jgi:exodeoxyribonuclease VII small subunit